MKYASLPMYDLPELRAATEAWWAGLAGHFSALGLDDAPPALTSVPGDRYAHWLGPDLLFSQTCGYPLTHRLAGAVKLLGTPCYDATGCVRADYRSLIIVGAARAGETLADLVPCRVAVNGFDSQSGWNALRPLAEALGGWEVAFAETIESGSHAASIDMVRDGAADLAAIDCLTHALTQDADPARLAGTRVLEMSDPAPALPYITAGATPDAVVDLLQRGVQNAVADPDLAEVRATLRIRDFEMVPLARYRAACSP